MGRAVPVPPARLTLAFLLLLLLLQLLSKCIHVSLATHLRNEYSASACLAWDKFLEQVADVLSEKYR